MMLCKFVVIVYIVPSFKPRNKALKQFKNKLMAKIYIN
jgi:hypothetical protein